MLLFYTRKLLSSFTFQFVTDYFVEIHTGMDEGRVHRTSVRDRWLAETSSITRDKCQLSTRLNNSPSELVVGVGAHHKIYKWQQDQNCVNLGIKTDEEEFGTRFNRPQSQTTHIGATPLQYYPNIMQSDVLCFLEPAVDQRSQLHYQHQLPEDKGVIYPPNFDAPSPVSVPVQSTLAGDTMHDGHVLHMDNVLSVTKLEVLEFQPSGYTHKVNIIVMWICILTIPFCSAKQM